MKASVHPIDQVQLSRAKHSELKQNAMSFLMDLVLNCPRPGIALPVGIEEDSNTASYLGPMVTKAASWGSKSYSAQNWSVICVYIRSL